MTRRPATPGEERIARAIAFVVVVGALSLMGIVLAAAGYRLAVALS